MCRKRSLKKTPETDAIFDNLKAVHAIASSQASTLRISLDTKAKVKIGEFSRPGYSRGLEPVKALDHDMGPEAIVVPAGILEVDSDQLNVIFGTSRDNAGFIADCIEKWWSMRSDCYGHIEKILINLDNAPEINSSRTQFMNRLVQFVDCTGLSIELAYYPPYHSKYNPIERCWGILEQHWNGTLLSSIETRMRWAETMRWRGVAPLVSLLEKTYHTVENLPHGRDDRQESVSTDRPTPPAFTNTRKVEPPH